LIGGRRQHGENGKVAGLAPMARLVDLEDELSSLPERFGKSEYHDDMRVANMSLRTPPSTRDDAILELMNDNPQTLFVVAAGNNNVQNADRELCRGVDVYPACEYARTNVLVVGATVVDGTTMLAPSSSDEGSHWSPKAVHVVAPGVGFESAGTALSYVPVRGTSFAAPLVTATAALLVAQGVDDPWAIKQRIIATADPISSLQGKVLGGRLNVERAVMDPHGAVLIDENGGRTVVTAVADAHELRIQVGTNPSSGIPFKNVLRLTRIGAGPNWRLVSRAGANADEVAVSERVRPDGHWTFSYFDLRARGAKRTDQIDRYVEYLAAVQ
jgi:subtilisin family serine protease